MDPFCSVSYLLGGGHLRLWCEDFYLLINFWCTDRAWLFLTNEQNIDNYQPQINEWKRVNFAPLIIKFEFMC